MHELKVAVIGAGVAGLTVAAGLAQQGHRVQILEQGQDVDTRGAALGLWPLAQQGLERIGVMQDLEADAIPYREGILRDPKGASLGKLPLAQIERKHGRPVVLVSRPALMRVLLSRARSSGVDQIQIGVRASLDDARGTSDLVVAADGIWSKARAYVAPRAKPPRSTPVTAWRGSCPGIPEVAGEVWGNGVFAGVTAGGPGATNWYVAVHDRLGVTSFDHLRQLVSDWPDPVPSTLARTVPADVLQHDIHDLSPLRTYWRENVVLAGDAAHAMVPSLGQGACQAVLDGVALVDAITESEDVRSALQRYERQRRGIANRLVRGSRALLGVQLLPGPALPVRDALLRVSDRLMP